MAAPGDPSGPPGAASFDAFVREYQDMVYAVALRLLANEADAEDVAQATFVRAYEQFGRLDPVTVAGWLRTVATHLSLNYLERHRSRWRLFSELGKAGDPPFDAPSDAPDPAEALDADQRRARLEEALLGLPAHQRVPLVLFHFEQRSYDDIARLLGVSLGKVKTDMHRGRLALKRWLA
ncbi:RNA polymerase sigma factor [Luteitalea sp. TBR-22]|uniref:RNA polymerase sigma factor n=1 Tax=Luteitalea sp. TBR-22 TaxID=2802971 RepID=UPI001EF4C498|nr:sigma-70 family RNA polymerase sigma factor [Luteitalea sp. TBR-22]